MAAWTELVAGVGALARAVVLPSRCAGCERQGAPLCSECAAVLRSRISVRWVRRTATSAPWPLATIEDHDGTLRRIVAACKDDERLDVVPMLAVELGRVVRRAVAIAGESPSSVRFLPVPSSAAARRRRGFRTLDLLGRALEPPPLREAAWLVRPPADQRGLGASRRLQNVRGSCHVDPASVSGRQVVVFDDVVTTGATLIETAAACEAAGGRVIALAALAGTPRAAGARHRGAT